MFYHILSKGVLTPLFSLYFSIVSPVSCLNWRDNPYRLLYPRVPIFLKIAESTKVSPQ